MRSALMAAALMVATLGAGATAFPARAAVTIDFAASGIGRSSLYGDQTGDHGARRATADGAITFDPALAAGGYYRFEGEVQPYPGVVSTLTARVVGDSLAFSFSRPLYQGGSLDFGLSVDFAAGYLGGAFPTTIDFARVVSSSLTVRQEIELPRSDEVTFFGALTALSARGSDVASPAAVASVALTNVPAVPEPATWALMIVGFGAAGYRMRRGGATVRIARAA